MAKLAPVFLQRERERKPWDHHGKTRQARGYGKAHDTMRAHLMATVILCEECTRQGRTKAGTIADHIKPLAQGGTGDRSNYQLLCSPCHEAKTARENGRGVRQTTTEWLDG